MEEAVSEFIIGTSQLSSKVCLNQLNTYVLENAMKQCPSSIRTFCIVGSAVEFSVQPLLHDIGDINIVLYSDEELACEDYAGNMQNDLKGFSDNVACFEIQHNDELSGFTQLRLSGYFTYNWESERYIFHKEPATVKLRSSAMFKGIRSESSEKFPSCLDASTSTRGTVSSSANKIGDTSLTDRTILSSPLLMMAQQRIPVDMIYSIRCLSWPKEANEWMYRPRTSGWPGRELIQKVVQNGCDVFSAELEDKHQWKFSFARAEVLLLKTWSPVQQIIYYMLRFLLRRIMILKHNSKHEKLITSYHLKTLMLWSCEKEQLKWWNSSNILVTCCKLIGILSMWLQNCHCPNYFIPKDNLFDSLASRNVLQRLLTILEPFHESRCLCQWFLENYIQQIHNTLVRSKDVSMNLKMVEQSMISACNFARQRDLKDLESWVAMISGVFRLTLSRMHDFGLLREFNTSDYRDESVESIQLTQFLVALDLLHVAGYVGCKNKSRNGFEVYDAISSLFRSMSLASAPYYPISYVTFLPPGKAYFVKAQKLMACLTEQKKYALLVEKFRSFSEEEIHLVRTQESSQSLTIKDSSPEFQLLAKLSIECLKSSLCLQDPADPIYYPSVGYLAALQHAIGQNETASKLGSWIYDHNKEKNDVNEYLNASLLSWIDDVTNVLGFILLFRRFARNKNAYRKNQSLRSSLITRVTTKLFAWYLVVICGSNRTEELLAEVERLRQRCMVIDFGLISIVLHKQRLLTIDYTAADVPVSKSRIYTREFSSCMNLDQCYIMTELEMVELMTESALGNLQTFFDSVSKTFNIRCSTALCYRVLYLYSRRRYGEVLDLCEKLIQDEYGPLLEMQNPWFAVTIMPPFDKFFDTDIQALLGFAYLFDRCCLDCKAPRTVVSLPMSGYSGYQEKLIVSEFNKKTFITGRFIANYLKLRCLMDMNRPLEQVLRTFSLFQSRLPFEHIIKGFVCKKVCIYVRSVSAFQTSDENRSSTQSLEKTPLQSSIILRTRILIE